MLAKLYQVSIPKEIADYDITDYDKALAYYKRLYELTGEVSILDSINSLYYYSLGDYENSLKTLKKIEHLKELNEWELMMYARLESYFGNHDHGMEYLLKTKERFYVEEAVLRIVTGNYHDITVNNKNDANEIKWVKAMGEYMESYKNEDQALTNEIKNKPIPDAITFLDNQELNAHGEFLKLSLKLLDPSLRRDTTKNIQEFIEKYAASEPELTKIAQRLFQY